MPRILRIINRFNLGGPTYNAAYLTKYLPSEYETLLVGGVKLSSEESSEFIVKDLGIEPYIIPEMSRAIRPDSDYQAFKKLKRLIKEYKPDIIHTHASKAGTLGRIAAIATKTPVIVHTFHGHVFHGYFNSISTRIYKNIERYLALRSTKIIAISNKQKEDLAIKHKICPESKISVIPLGFDLARFNEDCIQKRDRFRKKYNIEEDEIAIGIIGRLVPVKNHSLFLKALYYVKARTKKKIRAFIVGDGEERESIMMLAKQLNLAYICSDNIGEKQFLTFTSWIKEVDEVVSGMDIIALTSLNEGTPVSLIEAQAGNKPVVSTNVGGIEDIVVRNETGILCDSFSEESFGENILKVVNDDTLRLKLSQNGWRHIGEKFHYKRLVNDTVKLYDDLLRK